MNKLVPEESGGEFLLYQTEDGEDFGDVHQRILGTSISK